MKPSVLELAEIMPDSVLSPVFVPDKDKVAGFNAALVMAPDNVNVLAEDALSFIIPAVPEGENVPEIFPDPVKVIGADLTYRMFATGLDPPSRQPNLAGKSLIRRLLVTELASTPEP